MYLWANWMAFQLTFVDETSKDDHTIYRHYGPVIAESRAEVSEPFKQGKRYSLITALALDGYIAQRVERSVDGEIYEDFIINEVVCSFLLL